jgi:hypothetical protein
MRKKKMPDQSVKEYKNKKPNPDTKGKGNFPGFSKYIEEFKSLYGFGNFDSLYNFSIKAQGEGGYNV